MPKLEFRIIITLDILLFEFLAIWRAMTQSEYTKLTQVNKARADGRKSLLVYMEPSLIKELKITALNEDRNVYELVEEATLEWLKRRKK